MSPAFDATLCPTAYLYDISGDHIRSFAMVSQERGLPFNDTALANEVLTYLGLAEKGRVTYGALLLFGKEPQKFVPQSEVRCLHYEDDKLITATACQGVLYELAFAATDFVMSRTQGAYEIPYETVREAIVNALAHRDYTHGARTEVRLFPDRLEVWNPFEVPPRLDWAQLLQEHQSMPPNPLIAEALYLSGWRYSKGSGTLDMLAQCRQKGLPDPEFRLDRAEGFLTILRRKPALKPAPAALPPADPNVPETPAPPSAQVLLLLRLLWPGPLGSADLRERLGIKDRSDFFKRYLGPALEAGLIEPTLPDKPNSSRQQYRLTAKGAKLAG